MQNKKQNRPKLQGLNTRIPAEPNHRLAEVVSRECRASGRRVTRQEPIDWENVQIGAKTNKRRK